MLKRASELQRSSPATPNPSGLTLDELEEIAGEAGLDVELLRQAATELETSSALPKNAGEKLAGGPLRIVIERTLPFEAPETNFIVLIPGIENAFGGPGQLGQVGRTFSWHASRANSGRTQQVRVSIRTGQTTIRIEESYGGLVGGLYGGVLGGVGGGVGLGAGPAIGIALHSIALAFALPVLIISGTYASVRYGYKAFIENRRRVLDRLMQDITDVLSDRVPQSTR
jgi:hypothetical protein